MDDAYNVFDKLPKHNVIAITTMITGYAYNGYIDEALRLFWEMPETNGVSWMTVITCREVQCSTRKGWKIPMQWK